MTRFLSCFLLLLFMSSVAVMAQIRPAQQRTITDLRNNPAFRGRINAIASSAGHIQARLLGDCDDIVLTRQSEIDSFNILHPTCSIIGKLTINGINASPAIDNLDSLLHITTITTDLTITNTSVTNLSGFSNLVSIGGFLRVEHNQLLTSIGLNGLTLLGEISFRDLPVLTSMSGLSNNITTIGSVTIDSTALTSLNGLENITTMTTPFTGLNVANSPITSLSAITNLVTINGYIKLDNLAPMTSVGLNSLESCWGILFAGLPNLTSLGGLTDHLTTTNIGTFWMMNTGLTSLSGLHNLTSSSNFYIWFNQGLTSLQGLEGLSGNIDGGIYIWGNNNLTDVTALGNITSISNGSLEFRENNLLTDLTGIGNITNIGSGLWIWYNNNLSTLAAFNSNLTINTNNDDEVKIIDNPQLALCSFTPLCNYLGGGGIASVSGNSTGCNDISEIMASCASCTNGMLKTWTGDVSSDWDDANNWSPASVPATCDTVYIPEVPNNYPSANANISIHGLIMGQYSQLNLNEYNLVSNGPVTIDDAEINSYQNGNSISFRNSIDPHIANSSITASSIRITGYKGTLDLDHTNFNGDVVLTDSMNRQGPNNINGNRIYGHLTINTNSPYNSAETLLSQTDDDEIWGNLVLNLHGPAPVHIGAAYTTRIEQNLEMDADIDPQFISFNRIEFIGGSYSYIRQLGPVPISINYLNTSKNSSYAYIIPEQDLVINNGVHFFIGVVKPAPGSTVIFEDNSSVSQYSSSSWIWGPVKKRGNTQFTFPTGDSLRQGVLTILSTPQISNEYTAQYFHKNPALAGFDTTQHETSLSRISGAEYWTLNRSAGSDNVFTSLTYDSLRSNKTGSIYSLRVSQWSGSQWQNKGSIFLSGNLSEASLTSSSAITDFTHPLTLGYIEPPIIPVITIGNSDTVACKGGGIMVRFTTDTLMFSGNNFIVQLSDSTGSFSNPLNIGTAFNTNHADSINAFIPFNTPISSLYRVRVVGTSPPDTSINTRPLRIMTIPGIVTIQGPDPGCIGSGVNKYYANQKEAGVTYSWSLNGGGTMTSNQDTAYVTWTSAGTRTITLNISNVCGSRPSVNKQVTISNPPPAATPVLNKTGRWLYSTTPDANQYSLGYHWYRNDTLIGGAANSSYYASAAGTYKVKYYNLCGESTASNTFTFAANSIPQTITFSTITDKTYGDVPFALNATATSGFTVSFSSVNGPGSITGNTYTITTSGAVTIRATQAGDDVYDTASFVLRSFTVNKAAQTISFAPLGDKDYGAAPFNLTATSTSGLPVSYTYVSGPALLSGNQVTLTGLGTVTLSAIQSGDTNYLAASPVVRSFCVRVFELTSIAGPQFVCPGQTATYKINKIPGLSYSWRLSDGTTFSSLVDSVNITWGSPGSKTLIVSGSGPCGAASANDSLVVNIINAVTPGAVSNMLPANGSIGLQLPLTFSWIPGSNSLTYDFYVWDSASAQPTTAFAANLTTLSYSLLQNALAYNRTYKWKVVSKNACLQTDGPVQQFRLKALPDFVVSNVQAPATAFSGQTVSFNWRVTNTGPGNTATNQTWTDAVFLSFDTIPNFGNPPNTNPGVWSNLDFPVRTLLAGTKPNVTALDSGQHYDNSINFSLPLNYNQPLYIYVITNYPAGNNPILQMTYNTDTARAPQALAVTLSPTPDLRVDTVFTPASVFSGSTVNVTYKVKNYGVLTPAGSSWTDKLYISQSPFFNINTAIPLKQATANGTYYNSAVDAIVSNNTQLLPDSSYTKSVQAVIPNFISGTYFVHVVTNATGSLYEGALAGNNTNSNQLQVFLTPTPQLTISSLTVPVTTASSTQPIGITWNILNTGFNDNIEKNKGHYYKADGSCPGGLLLRDSVGFGSSYWIDNVYLGTNGSGLDASAILIGQVPHGAQYSGYVADAAPATKCVTSGTDPSSQNENTSNVIRPSSNHPGTLNFIIPANLPGGNYYVYVRSNATQTVFEYPGTPQIRRSDLPISIQRPDLIVSAVNPPASAIAGQSITINYNVFNNGPGSVFNSLRNDKIYVSSSPVFDGSAQLISTQSFTENIPANAAISHSLTYTFSPAVSGTRYFYVHTNYDSLFAETNSTNNISAAAAVTVSTAVPVDLVVSSMPLADSIFTLYNSKIKYTITNNGTGSTSGNWTDSIFISCSASFTPATSYYIGQRSHNEIIASGGTYTDSLTVNMPLSWLINNCFPETAYSTAYFFVKTNADKGVYEGSNGNNNTGGSGSRMLVNPLVDHIVTTVAAGDTATVARPYPVSWTVKNVGYKADYGNYSLWRDAVYFSSDSVFNNNAVYAGESYLNSTLEKNQTYSESKTITPPNIPTGDYYVWVKTNYANSIYGERVIDNNTNLLRNAVGAAKKVHIIQPLLPDLVDSILVAPALVAAGQPLNIIHKISNIGAGVSYPNSFSNEFWLSTDMIPNNTGDIWLSAQYRNTPLAAGQSYNDTLVTVNLGLNVTPGNYVLIGRMDAGNGVPESNENNNLTFSYVTVYSAQPSDLVVENISTPDTVYLGYAIDTAKWEVVNNSANSATGISSDGIYLSKNTNFDSIAILLAVKNKTINIAPLGRNAVTLQPIITNVTEGNYHVLVRTDLLNNIPETNKNNNTGIAAGSLYVKVKELKLNVPESNTLQSAARYYKLLIPDSLRGSTVLVTLKTNDSLTMRNEMYIGLGYVPAPAQFDYKFETPNYGNQQIVMTTVTDSIYYIDVRCVSANPVLQNITLKAVKLPFAILNVQSNSGGNTGNVTVKISGSLFTGNMIARLSKPGTSITASAIYYTNSTSVFATFNLQGKPLGVYDLTLVKPDSATAILSNGFTIVASNNGGINNGGGNNSGQNGSGTEPGCDPGAAAGLNSQLLTEVVVPAKVFAGWPFIVQINYSNPTNSDIAAQTRILYNDKAIAVALTQAGLTAGVTTLYLELTEPGGPPGIIRAGGSGTITIYAKAPQNTPGHTIVNFTLK